MATEITIPKGVGFIGKRWAFAVPVRNVLNAPLDVSGFAIKVVVRDARSGAVVGEATSTSGDVLVQMDQGVLSLIRTEFGPLVFFDDDNEPIDEGWYEWGMGRTDSGSEFPIAYGRVWLELAVEREEPGP